MKFIISTLVFSSLMVVFGHAYADGHLADEAVADSVASEGAVSEAEKTEKKKFRAHRDSEGMRDKIRDRHERHLKEIDTNGDQNIDLQEFLAHAERRFHRMDEDKNGLVTREEAKRAHKKMRKKHRDFFRKHHSSDEY